MLNSGKKSFISDDRIAQLEKLGFQCNSYSQLVITMACNEKLSELMEFKERWGHFDVPQKYNNNPNFGCWVSNHRSK